MLHIERIEIHRRQQHLRETSTVHQIGNRFTGIRKQYAGTKTGQQMAHLLRRKTFHLKNAGLLDFGQIDGVVFNLGGHSDRNHHFVKIFGEFAGLGGQLNIDIRLPLGLLKHRRRVGRLERYILAIYFLNLKFAVGRRVLDVALFFAHNQFPCILDSYKRNSR